MQIRYIVSTLALLAAMPFTVSAQEARPGSEATTDRADWSGFYIGFGAEYGGLTDSSGEYVAGTNVSNGFSGRNSDTSVGINLHLGYNVEVGNFVLGVEGRLRHGTTEDKDFQIVSGARTPDFSTSYASDRSWQIVARSGVRVGQDGLAYVALGRASANVTRGYYSSSNPAGEVFSGTDRGTIIGLGYERMMAESWSMRIEVSHIRYEQVTHTPAAVWSGLDDTHRARATSVSLSLSKHF